MPVSLKLVVGLIIVVVAAVTAVVAFVPTYLSGQDSVRTNVASLRVHILDKISLQVGHYFSLPTPVLHGIRDAIKRGSIPPDDPTIIKATAMDAVYHYPNTSMRVLYWGQPNYTGTVSAASADGHIYGLTLPGDPLLLCVTDPKTFYTYPNTNATPCFGPVPNAIAKIDMRSWFDLPSRTNHSTQWGPVRIAPPDTLRVFMSVGLFDPQGTWWGAVASPIDAGRLHVMLTTMGMSRNSRAIVYEEATGNTLGHSWDESPTWDTGIPHPVPLFFQTVILLRDVTNFTDPLMREATTAIGRPRLLNGTTPFAVEIGSGRGTKFVDVNHIRDEYGLRLRYIVVMPEEDFMEEIYAQQTKTIMGVVFAVFGLCVVAVVLVYLMLRALDRIAYRMALSAQLADDEGNDPLSHIAEVRNMQESYQAMKDELNRVKVFLPSAMHYPNEGDEEAREEELESVSSFSTVEPPRDHPMGSRNGSRPPSTAPEDRKFSRVTVATSASTSRQSSVRQIPLGRRVGKSFKFGASVAPKLNTAAGLSSRNVTVMVINAKGFHARTAGLDAGKLEKLHQSLVDTVQRCTTDQRGVVDFFNGDHFVVSFNATRMVAQHAKAAAMAAHNLLHQAKDTPGEDTWDLSIGIASGRCTVGNMGNDTMRRFCILGPVYSHAIHLERLTASYGVPVLATHETTTEIELAVYYQYVDLVQLPFGKKEQLLATFDGLRTAQMEEWMYQIEESQGKDPYGPINAAFTKLCSGDKDGAKALLCTMQQLNQSFPGTRNLERSLQM